MSVKITFVYWLRRTPKASWFAAQTALSPSVGPIQLSEKSWKRPITTITRQHRRTIILLRQRWLPPHNPNWLTMAFYERSTNLMAQAFVPLTPGTIRRQFFQVMRFDGPNYSSKLFKNWGDWGVHGEKGAVTLRSIMARSLGCVFEIFFSSPKVQCTIRGGQICGKYVCLASIHR